MKRRKFIQSSTLIGLTGSLATKNIKENANSIILSTWNNKKANIAAWENLMKNGMALDAVEAGVKIPEADPNDISVGYGGLPDREGHVTLDACIMDHLGNAGSVTFLENIMHPISVARAVMEKTPHVMLSGKGAYEFALSQGFRSENLLTENSKLQWEKWKEKSQYKPIINIERHDTIGMLGIGKKGEMAGACTTSGLAFKMHGRVGDSPIIGAAMFVDDEIGGACATGMGEFVMKTLGSFLIVELMRQGMSPQKACEEAILRIVKKNKVLDFQVGYLALNKKGEIGAYSIQKGFNFTITENGETKTIDSDYYLK